MHFGLDNGVHYTGFFIKQQLSTNLAPKMGALWLAPTIGAMKSIRLSIYDPEQLFLRNWLIQKRNDANCTQRELAKRLDIVHSVVGKVEKGERRLDVIEFITYCEALNVDPCKFIRSFRE